MVRGAQWTETNIYLNYRYAGEHRRTVCREDSQKDVKSTVYRGKGGE